MTGRFHVKRLQTRRAVAGIRLRSIFDRVLVAPTPGEVPGYLADNLDRQTDFIDCLDRADGRAVFDLRFVSRPGLAGAPGSLQVALLCVAEDDPGTVNEAAAQLAEHALTLLRASFPEYWFEPITKASELDELRMEPRHVCEILRREDDIALYVPFQRSGRRRIGFLADDSPAPVPGPQATGDVHFVFPFAPTSDTTARLGRLLTLHPEPLAVSFRLKPTTLSGGEEDAFRRLLGSLEAVRTLPSAGAAGAPIEEYADLLTLMKEQAGALSDVVTLQMTRLIDTAFEFSIQVASESLIPPAVVQELGVVITRPAAEPVDSGPYLADSRRAPFLVGGYTRACLDGAALDDARQAFENLDVVESVPSSGPRELSRWRRLCSPAEAVSFFRFPLPGSQDYPGIETLKSRTGLAADSVPSSGLILGTSRCPTAERIVGLGDDDRRRHLYAVGQTGTGKTTFFESMILQDIRAGRGLCVMDPHGDLVERLLGRIPAERLDDVVYLDPSDAGHPVGLNLLEWNTQDERYFLVQELNAIMMAIAENPDFAGPVFQHYIRNFALLLTSNADDPGTLVDLPRLYTDKSLPDRWLPHVTDPMVRQFWVEEWPKISDFHRSEHMVWVLSKFGPLVGDRLVRNLVGQARSTINIAEIMDNRRILLVNLAKGRLGETCSRMIGMIVVARIMSAALQRVNRPESQRTDFHLYVDEFQNVATLSFSNLLSEARKFGLSLMLTNQFFSQVDSATWARSYHGQVSRAILGNVGTFVTFRVGPEDADLMERFVTPDFQRTDLMNLPNFRACVSTLVNGAKTRAFTMDTHLDPTPWDPRIADDARYRSRQRCGRPVDQVEAEITRSLSWKKG